MSGSPTVPHDAHGRAPVESPRAFRVDPVVFCKLQLVMFFDGIRSERQLIEMASLNLSHRQAHHEP